MKQLINKNKINPLKLLGSGALRLLEFLSSGVNNYSFKSHWRVEAKAEEVFEILQNPSDLPRWWPAVYLKTRTFGDPESGLFMDFLSKGWLPFTVKWQAKIVESNFPKLLRIQSFGDLLGEGAWSLKQDGAFTNIYFAWKVIPEKQFLRRFTLLLKPIFAANHAWAMKMGERSLELEIQRRKAKNQEELARIPAPPKPTTKTDFVIAAASIGLLLWFIQSKICNKKSA